MVELEAEVAAAAHAALGSGGDRGTEAERIALPAAIQRIAAAHDAVLRRARELGVTPQPPPPSLAAAIGGGGGAAAPAELPTWQGSVGNKHSTNDEVRRRPSPPRPPPLPPPPPSIVRSSEWAFTQKVSHDLYRFKCLLSTTLPRGATGRTSRTRASKPCNSPGAPGAARTSRRGSRRRRRRCSSCTTAVLLRRPP